MENKSSKYMMDRVELANIKTPDFINETLTSNQKYVDYGDDNLFPQLLIELSNKSTTHTQCLKLISIAVAGDGYTVNNESAKAFLESLDYETANCSMLEKIGNSMTKFYGACIEVVWNKKGDKIVGAQFLPFENIRSGKADKYGTVSCYFHNSDWVNHPNEYEEIFAFNPAKVLDGKEVVQGKQLLYISFYTDISKIYPVPDYVSAINYISSEYEMSKHMISSITNGFVAPSLITFVGNPTPEERMKNKKMFEKSFTGSENAGKIIINYVERIEDKLNIDVLTSSHIVDEYMNASQECKQNIITSHGIISPSLVAIPDGGSAIFSNGDELKTAWEVFYKVKIASYQSLIEKSMDLILKYAGFPNSQYKITPFSPINVEVAQSTDTQGDTGLIN